MFGLRVIACIVFRYFGWEQMSNLQGFPSINHFQCIESKRSILYNS